MHHHDHHHHHDDPGIGAARVFFIAGTESKRPISQSWGGDHHDFHMKISLTSSFSSLNDDDNDDHYHHQHRRHHDFASDRTDLGSPDSTALVAGPSDPCHGSAVMTMSMTMMMIFMLIITMAITI